jgi:hypothetical protein
VRTRILCLIVAGAAGCGGGSGDEQASAPPPTAVEADLKTLAASMQLLRATVVLGIAGGVVDRALSSSPGQTTPCDSNGTFRRDVTDSAVRVQMQACSAGQGPGIQLTGLLPGNTTLVTGLGVAGTGKLLGITESVSIADSGTLSATMARGGGSIAVRIGQVNIRFASGANYRVGNAIIGGSTTARSADVAYVGSFSTQFDYNGRSHVVSSTSPLTWEPTEGLVGGTLIASFSDATGIRNYDIRFESDGRVEMSGLAGIRSASFSWQSTQFQSALRAVLAP